MVGITSAELKLPRFRKRIWIGLLIIMLLGCGLVLLPSIIYFNYQVEWRVSAAVHMIPDAELRYSDTTDFSEYIKAKKIIYWVNMPFEKVKDYPFITKYRERSDSNMSGFSEVTPDYSYRIYYLSDLPQKELDAALYFAPSDVRDEPFKITSVWFYIIAANFMGNKNYFINALNYEHLAGKEMTGTYIVYTYRIR